MKILIIEDEKELLETVRSYLASEGYLCETASTYFKAEDSVSTFTYDIIILDITLPDGNGLDLMKIIKGHNPLAGLLIVSARDSLNDKLLGLDKGADDYITKPFHLSELNSRIRAITRRRLFNGVNEISLNEILIKIDFSEVYINGEIIELTKKEYNLLLYFLTNKDKVLTHEAIAEHIWGDNTFYADNFDFIYSHIKNLRKKIEQKSGNNYVRNIYGLGYKFTDK